MFTDLCQKLVKVSKMREPKKNFKPNRKLIDSNFLEDEEVKKKGCCKN